MLNDESAQSLNSSFSIHHSAFIIGLNMVELFRNPKIDWINAKKFFIGITIVLLLVGAISVQIRGFNLGVDFTGGTLMDVRFKEMTTLATVRSALGEAGIDTTKVTLQPVTSRP